MANKKQSDPISHISEFLSKKSRVPKILFNDRVDHYLNNSPLAICFYNQRFLFLVFSLFFLILLGLFHFYNSTSSTRLAISFYSGFAALLLEATVTLSFHSRFIKYIQEQNPQRLRSIYKIPPIFELYIFFDFIVVCALVVIGIVFDAPLHGLAFLLVANLLVYSVYAPGAKSKVLYILFGVQLSISFLAIVDLYYNLFGQQSAPHKYSIQEGIVGISIAIVCFSGSLVFLIVIIRVIANLRNLESRVFKRSVELLEEFSTAITTVLEGKINIHSSGRIVLDRALRRVFRKLCSRHSPLRDYTYWYEEACFLYADEHQDHGIVYRVGATHKFTPPKNDYLNQHQAGILTTDKVILLESINKHIVESPINEHFPFYKNRDISAAVVPITLEYTASPRAKQSSNFGVLVVFGKEGHNGIKDWDEPFLSTLGSIIADGIHQSRHIYLREAKKQIDQLFEDTWSSLPSISGSAVNLLTKLLNAEAGMFIHRPDPNDDQMTVASWTGIADSVKDIPYRVGLGETGRCALIGEPIRYDSATNHLDDFSPLLYDKLQRVFGKPIESWLALPIGSAEENYGVIKVINKKNSWFADDDIEIGKALANTLHTIIHKLSSIEAIETEKRKSIENAEVANKARLEAVSARIEAEKIAQDREENIMSLTHQLLGPLVPSVGAVSGLIWNLKKDPFLREDAMYALDLINDTLAMCQGALYAFALIRGQSIRIAPESIDVLQELELLSKRLQRTNSRDHDLKFTFSSSSDFPNVQIDKRIFINVMYCLIHNAIKYSFPNRRVEIECEDESHIGAAIKVKSYGEPILLSEKDSIFERFVQGSNVKKGRYHGGVGLGLWIAKELMQAIGGKISLVLTPETPNLSIFVVELP